MIRPECDVFDVGSRQWRICRGDVNLSHKQIDGYRRAWGMIPLFADGEASKPVVVENQIPELIFHGASVSKAVRRVQYGPGTELLKIYAEAGVPTCPACVELAQEMNNWGVTECRKRIGDIVLDILPRAKQWIADNSPWAARLIPDAVEEFGIKFKLRMDINKAIDAAEQAIKERSELRVATRAIWASRTIRATQISGGSSGCCGGNGASSVTPTAKRRPRLPGSGRIPDEPMTPVRATISDRRNLLYHLWPSNNSSNWKTAVEQLLKRIDLFNGVRSISVVTDSGTASLDEVQAEFAGVRVDNWLTFTNNPKLREGVSFLPLMATLPNDDSVTFLGHGKSAKHQPGSICVDWAETQYRLLLDDWESTRIALELFPIVGAFKRYGPFGSKCRYRWHYSGGIYCMRQADVFAKTDWKEQLAPWFGTTESWPGGVFPQSQAYCIGPDNVGDLYRSEAWAAIKPELDSLFRVRDKLRTGLVDDETFFAQSKWKGYTTWDWLPLVEAHTRVAVYLRDVLGCRSVLEIGSGLGMFLVGAKATGLDASGFDRNDLERDFAISKGVPPDRYELALVDAYTIRHPVDAIYSCEVFEHCTDDELAPLCRQISAHCKWFYFTSTPYLATGEVDRRQGHINIKSREEWLAFFSQFGLTWYSDDKSVCEWGMVLKGDHYVCSD